MNQLVARWQEAHKRHQEDPGGPDSIEIEGEGNLYLREAAKVVEKSLPKNQFDNVIRAVKSIGLDRVKFLQVVFKPHARRLGVSNRPKHAVAGVPDGSDQFDAGSLRDWVAKVEPGDTAAVAQVMAIYATIKVRLGV